MNHLRWVDYAYCALCIYAPISYVLEMCILCILLVGPTLYGNAQRSQRGASRCGTLDMFEQQRSLRMTASVAQAMSFSYPLHSFDIAADASRETYRQTMSLVSPFYMFYRRELSSLPSVFSFFVLGHFCFLGTEVDSINTKYRRILIPIIKFMGSSQPFQLLLRRQLHQL